MGCCSSTKEKRWCAEMLESSKRLGKGEGGDWYFAEGSFRQLLSTPYTKAINVLKLCLFRCTIFHVLVNAIVLSE